MLNELYRQYGQLMIQFELTQNGINELKKKIAQELNQTAKVAEPPVEPVKEEEVKTEQS